MTGIAEQLKQKGIPAHMMPGNVGENSKVHWPFMFNIEFDLGVDPIFSAGSRQQKFFQVTQEAGFLLCGISRAHNLPGTGGEQAPLGIDIRDRQSSRQLNNNPIPIQVFGRHSNYLPVHEPFWIPPNAYVDITLSYLGDVATDVNDTGGVSSKVTLTFWGYRMRNPQIGIGGTNVDKATALKGYDHLGALRPANVGSQGSVLWPYVFTFGQQPNQIPTLAPGQSADTFFTVSQEAAFLCTHMIATNYVRGGASPYTYLQKDWFKYPLTGGNSPDLNFTLQDPQSGRFYNVQPTPIDFLGCGDFPSVLQSPLLLLPNSNMIARLINNHTTDTYCPYISLFGYRLRLDDMDRITSLTTG